MPLYPNTMAKTSSSVEPSTKGRDPAGTSSMAIIHDSDVTTVLARSTPTRARRRSHRPSPTMAVPITNAGTMNHACIILAWKPMPMNTPAHTSGQRRLVSAARCHQSSATASDIVSRPSSMGWPNIDTKIGVDAAAPAAINPTTRPRQRRPITAQTKIVTSPSITCGSASADVDIPNSRTLSACGTAKPLSLSRVTVAAGSNAPNSSACHDCDIDRTDAS